MLLFLLVLLIVLPLFARRETLLRVAPFPSHRATRRREEAPPQQRLDMLRVGFVFFDIAALLPLVVHCIFFQIRLINVIGGHAERLRE